MVEEKKETKTAEVVDVTATTTRAFKLEDGTIISLDEFLVRMYNKLLRIEKATA